MTEVLPEPPRRRTTGPPAKKGKKPRGQAAHRLAVQVDVAGDGDARARRCSCCRCRASVGKDPESGEEITAQNGRYGPYLKKGTDSRSLTNEEQLFTVTLDEALKIYAEPKQRGAVAPRRRRCASWAPTPRRRSRW